LRSLPTRRSSDLLPFSDHCDPLEDRSDAVREISSFLVEKARREHWNYIEARPVHAGGGLAAEFQEAEAFYWHTLDLSPGADELFGGFHRDSVQRRIRRAEREGLTYEAGRNAALLRKFYHVQVLTRKRHGLPPQPVGWFENLMDSMGEQLTIRVASKDGEPAAAVLTLRFGDKVVYKNGGSDVRLNRFGGMPLLF